MQVLKKGAEATVYLTETQGINSVIKARKRKKYRNALLDQKLRKQRTKREAKLLNNAKRSGIETPAVLKTDPEKGTLALQFIKGKKAKDCIKKNTALCREIGKSIAKMHNNTIIHGDLTLDNILWQEKKAFFIDFGLGFRSNRTEDKATDLIGLKKSIMALKPNSEKEWGIIEKNYFKKSNCGKEMRKKIQEIEQRKRYA